MKDNPQFLRTERHLLSLTHLATTLQVNEDDVKKANHCFALGSSCGPDGLRPKHVINLLGCNDYGPALLSAITAFINMLFRGHCPSQVVPEFLLLIDANLTAL